MEITKLGEHCFKIKGRQASLLIAPSAELKNLRAHILLLSTRGKVPKIKGEPVVIFGPGEYEVRQVRVLGIKEKGKGVYKIEMDGLSCLYLGDLEEEISEEKVELLGSIDILFLPLKRAKAASFLVSQFEPLIVIPTAEEEVEEFLKEEGIEKVERLSKFTLTKEELPEERRIVILKQN